MNKELEAWEKIKSGYICGQGAINEFALRENERENFKIIETALKNYQDLTEYIDTLQGDRDYWYNIAVKNEKKLKAYEIIINNFDFDFDDETLTISMPYDLCENDIEEYELLKETLL